MHIRLLLVPKQRMEECVDHIGVRNLIGGQKNRLQEHANLGQSPLGHCFDIGTANMDSTGKAGEGKTRKTYEWGIHQIPPTH